MADTTLRMILLGDDRSAGKALKGVGSEADKTSSKMSKFHAVGSAAGKALSVGLLGVGAAAVAMTKKAADDDAAAAKLSQTLHKAAGATDSQVASTEAFITAQGKAYGVTDDELRPALSRLAVATGSVTKARKLSVLAENIAAGSGKSLTAVSTALAKAQTGSVGGLSKLGVATKDAAGKTLSLHDITKKLSSQYSGAAAAGAQTAAGKQKILTVQMGELQEQIGANLLPVMAKLADIGLKIVSWISNNTKVAGILVAAIGALVAITWAVSAATKAWTAVTKIAAAAQKIWTGIQWAFNAAMEANPIGLVVLAVVALIAVFILAYKKVRFFHDGVNAAFHGITNAVKAAFDWVKSHWKLLLAILTGPIGAAVIFIITHWQKIKDATRAVWDWIKDKLSGFLGFVKTIPGKIGTALHNMWDSARNAMTAFGQWERDRLNDLLAFVRGIPAKIAAFAKSWATSGAHLINSLFDGIVSAAKSGAGFVGQLMQAIVSAVNSALHLPLSINFDKGPLHIHSTLIPALPMAKGGIVTRPTFAMIGEAGPEAVIPLSRGGGGSRGNLGTLTVIVKGPGAREQQQLLLNLKRTNGGLALGLS